MWREDPFESGTRPATIYRASALQRDYRRVLDAAHEAPVPILDRDEILAVDRWSSLAYGRGVVEALEEIGQFQAAWALHREDEPSRWVASTPFPWLASLTRDEVAEFAAELLPYLLESVRRKDLTVFAGNLRAWESTAETYEDDDMLAATTAALDELELVQVAPPSEAQVEAAAAGDSEGPQ